jgi:ATP-dependent Clp protease ATP-binding subunit ClpA
LDEAGAIAHLNSSGDEEEPPIVDEHTVAEVISDWAKIPLGKLESGEMDRLVSLEDDMTQRVKGQGRAIQAVARAVRRARSGLRDPNRPIASFMFCGPTGTGKVRPIVYSVLNLFVYSGFTNKLRSLADGTL